MLLNLGSLPIKIVESTYRFEGSYSPRLLHGKDLPPDAVIIDAEEDALTVEGKRKLLTRTGDAGTGQEDAFVRIAQEGMDKQEEATFAVEAPIAQQVNFKRKVNAVLFFITRLYLKRSSFFSSYV